MLAGLLLFVSGCTASDRIEVAFQLRDSAGVQLVLNGGATDSATVIVDPELRVGQAMGEAAYEFHRLGPITVARDGTIFAANGGTSIRVFTADGTFVREFGRQGQGPGEFRAIHALRVHGDSLIVLDRSARRATVFRTDGTLVDTWDLRVADGSRVEPVALSNEGVLALVATSTRELSLEPFSLFRDTTHVRNYDPATLETGPSLRSWPGMRRIAWAEVYPHMPLFEPHTLTAVLPDGTQYHSTDGAYTIDVFNASGTRVRSIRRDVAGVPNDDALMDALAAALGDRGGEQAMAVSRAQEHPRAPVLSVLAAILPAPDGALIVLRMDVMDPVALERGSGFTGSAERRAQTVVNTSAARWERFDAEGRYAGAIRLPMRFMPHAFDGTSVIGVLQDDDDVQYIARYRLPDLTVPS
jgi:hypothetical protein